MTKIFVRKQVAYLIMFMGLIAVAHSLLLIKSLPAIYYNAQPWLIYSLLIPLTFVGVLYIHWKYQKNQTSVVNSFMIFTTIKMVTCFLFLCPWLFNKTEYTKPFIFQFFIIFFIFLFLEIRVLVQMLSNSSSKIEKN